MQWHRSVRPDGGDATPGVDDTESMLDAVLAGLLEDSYDEAAARRVARPDPGGSGETDADSRTVHAARRRRRLTAALGLLTLAVLMAAAVAQAVRSQPDVTAEQRALVKRVQDETAQTDALTARQEAMSRQVDALRAAAAAGAGTVLATTAPGVVIESGTTAATGPGLQVTADDAQPADLAGSTDPQGRILDIDLQYLVNGLWWAGAEAIAINGQRLGPMTAIRSAGEAITVDYRPLARPYVVSAIGDPKTLQARFLQSPGGDWMRNLKSLHGITFDVTGERRVTVPADTTTTLRYAGRPAASPTTAPSARPLPSGSAAPHQRQQPTTPGGTR